MMRRRIKAGEAGVDDRTRYRIACATVERAARIQGEPIAHVDANDLLAWLEGIESATVVPPEGIADFAAAVRPALAGSGPLAEAVDAALRRMAGAGAGLVITLAPIAPDAVAVTRAASRPDRPATVRDLVSDPELATTVRGLPRTADEVFAADPARLRAAATLRRQLCDALRAGQPLPIGAQAKHEVLTEVLRELHHPAAPNGRLRLLFATESAETRPFAFGPLPVRPPGRGRALTLGLMSMRHTELDTEVAGYWFRNRLVSVPGRSFADVAAYCHRDSVPRLHRLAASGVSDLLMHHTGFEPAVIGFYRAVAEVTATTDLRVRPFYLAGHGTLSGTPWPALPTETGSL
ncbi:hypothetical protein OG588_33940 [Streptomyces prunicolor]|uniref:hypothetical protein n=1 Tax=Streptomyces prunicolor TaxID=67348 RepID=UPI00386F7CB2|nr:hypothetical protein OG588_33940 [Streptomyces prunicolor]